MLESKRANAEGGGGGGGQDQLPDLHTGTEQLQGTK